MIIKNKKGKTNQAKKIGFYLQRLEVLPFTLVQSFVSESVPIIKIDSKCITCTIMSLQQDLFLINSEGFDSNKIKSKQLW